MIGQVYLRYNGAVASNGKKVLMLVGELGVTDEELKVLGNEVQYVISGGINGQLLTASLHMYLGYKKTGDQIDAEMGWNCCKGTPLGDLLHQPIWRC